MSRTFRIAVDISPRVGLADPQSETVKSTLDRLGFKGVSDCSVGKRIVLELAAASADAASREAKKMCDVILANPVMEDVAIEVLGEGQA